MKLEEYLEQHNMELYYMQEDWVVARMKVKDSKTILGHYHPALLHPSISGIIATKANPHAHTDYEYGCGRCGASPPGRIKLIAYTMYGVRPHIIYGMGITQRIRANNRQVK